eukprot:gene7770-9097_t
MERERAQEAGMLFEPTMRAVQEVNKTLTDANERAQKWESEIQRLEREIVEARRKKAEAEKEATGPKGGRGRSWGAARRPRRRAADLLRKFDVAKAEHQKCAWAAAW